MEDLDLRILSYDVDGRDRSTASRVCHLIFGRKNRTTHGGVPTPYDQPGFIHRAGVVWVEQSVLILPLWDASSFAAVSTPWGLDGHGTARDRAGPAHDLPTETSGGHPRQGVTGAGYQ